MANTPDQQVTNTAVNLGCLTLAAGLIALPPLVLPFLIVFRIAKVAGERLHPAAGIVVGLLAGWLLYKGLSWSVRSLPPQAFKLLCALYISASYCFAIFQRELTTARHELDLAWLMLAFAVFAAIGWKVGALLIPKSRTPSSQ